MRLIGEASGSATAADATFIGPTGTATVSRTAALAGATARTAGAIEVTTSRDTTRSTSIAGASSPPTGAQHRPARERDRGVAPTIGGRRRASTHRVRDCLTLLDANKLE
jgi:hypothetical protein